MKTTGFMNHPKIKRTGNSWGQWDTPLLVWGKAKGAVSRVQKGEELAGAGRGRGRPLSGTNWKEEEIGEKGNHSTCQKSTHMAETAAPLLHAFLSLSTLPPASCQIKFLETQEKVPSGSVDRTLGRETEMWVWKVLPGPSLAPFPLGLAATLGLHAETEGEQGSAVGCSHLSSLFRWELALGVSAWKLKWPDSDSETTEVLEADGFL